MWLFCVELLLQVPHKANLESVDVFDVPENHFKLVLIKHVPSLFAVSQVTLHRREAHLCSLPLDSKEMFLQGGFEKPLPPLYTQKTLLEERGLFS